MKVHDRKLLHKASVALLAMSALGAPAYAAKAEDGEQVSFTARVVKIDGDEQICFAEVYAPSILDTHSEFMDADGVRQLAHKFMQLPDLSRVIDTNHNNVPNGSYPIESFIARKGDPDYTPGAWVLGIKVQDPDIWRAVKTGKLNGFSFEAYVRKTPAVVIVSLLKDNLGETEANEGHSHLFFAQLDDDGRVVSGRTTTDAGHSHEIKRGTATEMAGGHAHRIFIGE